MKEAVKEDVNNHEDCRNSLEYAHFEKLHPVDKAPHAQVTGEEQYSQGRPCAMDVPEVR
eukprot:CAMPEP_0172896580 /NCGR_PEP_ID=MMETSP1075-20121228/155792_1 /TAXON_ID=2916 /ORGANISM="Ceratium fusus, Strain PA161109" /LENGTH=58 /DNA_ID=CAMNT_0013752007 /DNA_START=227 /DNA_END=400 /DNA_ORIENTATION=+